jgi:hypothetical protein
MKGFLFALIGFSMTAFAGGVGNGGDPHAQDFVTSAQDGFKFLLKHKEQFTFTLVTANCSTRTLRQISSGIERMHLLR